MMPKITWGTVLRLLIASLAVGMVLAFLGWEPIDFWRWIADAIKSLFDTSRTIIEWAAIYVGLGALVVIPIWVLMYVLRIRRKGPEGETAEPKKNA